MTTHDDLRARMMQKYGGVIDLEEHPEALDDIVGEVRAQIGSPAPAVPSPVEPFGVSWMDSWVAHWVYEAKQPTMAAKNREVASALRALTDVRFNERIDEIRRFILDRGGFTAVPDGGPPEPGPPAPAGPAVFAVPDGGPPEPGPPAPAGPAVFTAGPDGGPPEPGPPAPAGPAVFAVPDGGPPEPGTPPAGPTSGFVDENPWILYWFVSIKAPLLLEVIDLHLTRRLEELSEQPVR